MSDVTLSALAYNVPSRLLRNEISKMQRGERGLESNRIVSGERFVSYPILAVKAPFFPELCVMHSLTFSLLTVPVPSLTSLYINHTLTF